MSDSEITSELRISELGLTARGTQDGLVLRVSGLGASRIGGREILWDALRSFIQARRNFVEGNQVIIEWTGAEPAADTVAFVRANVLREFDIDLIDSGLAEDSFDARENEGSIAGGFGAGGDMISGGVNNKPNLFGGMDGLEDYKAADFKAGLGSSGSGLSGGQKNSAVKSSGAKLGATPKVGWGEAVANWDDADARVVYGTLRSGQKVETEHSVLVFGDVNSGAEIVAGGDVIVLGNLRGVAHAGAYDEKGGGRVIFALHLEPTQLRIGAVISRGGLSRASGGGATPEIARVDGQGIVVEPYQAKGAPNNRKAA